MNVTKKLNITLKQFVACFAGLLITFFPFKELDVKNAKLKNTILTERQALMDLFEATGGEEWLHNEGWGNGMPSNNWYGIRVNAKGRVIQLNLRDNNLRGQLPASFGNLSQLTYINLKQNHLTGVLPTTIGQMESLQYLLLAGRGIDPPPVKDYHPGKQDETTNEFTGSLPPSWGNLPNIIHIELSHNSLEGKLPASWGRMSTLRGLWLNGNGLSGTLPASLGSLTNLRNLTLSHNNFVGDVPEAWAGMQALQFLRLNNNQLEGNFSKVFSKWRYLELFYLNKNKFSGPFPSFLVSGKLNRLTTIGLAHNNFSGPLPSLAPLLDANIYVIELDNNHFNGQIPPEVTHMPKAVILSFGWNEFTGPLPQRGWSNLHHLRFLRVTSNNLTGAIPSELPDNTDLRWLWFQDNDFTSADPMALASLSSRKLEIVDISGNHLVYEKHIAPAISSLSHIDFRFDNQTPQ